MSNPHLLRNGVSTISINDIDIENEKDRTKLIEIFNYNGKTEEIFFELKDEDAFFTEETKTNFYREYLPVYLNQHGKYIITNFNRPGRYEALASLPKTEKSLEVLFMIWEFYENITFFTPYKHITWDFYVEQYYNVKNKSYGMRYIISGCTDLVYTTGHEHQHMDVYFDPSLFNNNFIKAIEDILLKK